MIGPNHSTGTECRTHDCRGLIKQQREAVVPEIKQSTSTISTISQKIEI